MPRNVSLISHIKTLIKEGGRKEEFSAYEDDIADSIEKYAKEESFYELPTNEILKIIRKSEIGDLELICELISRMFEKKGEESTLLLNVIKIEGDHLYGK